MTRQPLNIVADENIPYVAAAFAPFGTVTSMPGRDISAANLKNADVLLVRSVTRVDRHLLDGSHVGFVGTATIGTDHVDEAYLDSRGISFAAAPGSNALSVAEYITAALLRLCDAGILSLPDVTVAVVGAGNVGGRVVSKLQALRFKALVNDPPLRDATGDEKYLPLREILPSADVVTVHTPLTKDGNYPTYHLVDEPFLAQMKPGAVLINSSRGAVVDETSLLRSLRSGHLAAAVLDVWNNEPSISTDTLAAAFIATPHIAGYAFDGKVRGTLMLHRALASHLGRPASWDMLTAMPPPPVSGIDLPPGLGTHKAVSLAVRTAYDINEDDNRTRRILALSPSNRSTYFDYLRKTYPVRREFPNITVTCPSPCPAARMLSELGFMVTGDETACR
ncbi:MAG: 4-phosphoerythronate dehydrogenase [Planctomycetes bacterium]|nr:4-phosphoerythronate dehydrogenase [Planctomycetota bacterium]